MAGRDLDADFLIGASAGVKASMTAQHWKYPQNCGSRYNCRRRKL